MCCLLVLNLVSSTLSCIRQPRPRLQGVRVYHTGPLSYRSHFCPPSPLAATESWRWLLLLEIRDGDNAVFIRNAPPWVGSRSPDGWDQIPRWAGGWSCTKPPWSFGFDSQPRGTRENRPTLCHSTGFLTGPKLCNRYCSNKHTHTIVVCTLSGGCVLPRTGTQLIPLTLKRV